MVLAGQSQAANGWQWIDGQQVQAMMQEGGGLWLIDVRGEAAYQAQHIEGAVNIPADALAHKTFAPQKQLVLVDDSLGQRAAREAADVLTGRGQQRVSVLEGGVAAWKLEGRPTVETLQTVRGVTAQELAWAAGHAVPMDIYDLRPAADRTRSPFKDGTAVEGNTVAERAGNAKKKISAAKNPGLAARMEKPRPVVLVFSASEDAEGLTRQVRQSSGRDVRYLIGGYEAMTAKKPQAVTAGVCPTCPGKTRR